MNIYIERLQTWKSTSDTVERIENDYTQVINFIDENPEINVLKKIGEIENFINSAIENLNQTKDFKVHDLSIYEKVRPLRAFLGNILNQEKPPKVILKNEEKFNTMPLKSSLSSKIMDALHKNRSNSNSRGKEKTKFPKSTFKEPPYIIKSKEYAKNRLIKMAKTPQRNRIPQYQETHSFSNKDTELDLQGIRDFRREY